MPRATGSGKRGASHKDKEKEKDKDINNERRGDVTVKRAHLSKKSYNVQGDLKAVEATGEYDPNSPTGTTEIVGLPPKDWDSKRHKHGDATRRQSTGAASDGSSSDSSFLPAGANGHDHRHIDINASKNNMVHRDSGPVELASSVLKSLPVHDTIAILIILMQMPSVALAVIYAVFTCLTFIPPTSSSFLDGNSTMPSLVTVLCMDFFFMLTWLFLWQPIQNTILDLAKPVIALTLGGGTGSRYGPSRGIPTTFFCVLLHHLLRGTRAHWYRIVPHLPPSWRLLGYFGDSLEMTTSTNDKRSAYAWIRSGLAIHILTQGLVRFIREWYLRREKGAVTAGTADPEAAKSHGTTGHSLSVPDIVHENGHVTPDAEMGLTQSGQPSTKKKKKQSALVRLQQPLWAALASTKIVFIKEIELSHLPYETVDANATDIQNLGNAPFDKNPGKFWISYIGSDEICFNTSFLPNTTADLYLRFPKDCKKVSRPAGVDTTKPFYVTVNDAFWQPTRIFQVEDEEPDPRPGSKWAGDIYGLRPASKYVCEFVDTRTDNVIFTASIRTVKESQEADIGPISPPPMDEKQSLQPDSPVTTLQTSIDAANHKLSEEKNKLKTWRKEWKFRINALKKENELTDNQLSSAGNSDEKYKQKIRQQETQKVQAERDAQLLAEKLKQFDSEPTLQDRKKKVDKNFASEKKSYENALAELQEVKNRLEGETKAKEVEKANLNSRRNKIATRIAKVDQELSNLKDANQRGVGEAERRSQQRAKWTDHITEITNNYAERINHVCAENAAKMEYVRALEDELQNNGNYLMNGANQAEIHASQQSGSGWNAIPASAYASGLWGASSGDMSSPIPAVAVPATSAMWNPGLTVPAVDGTAVHDGRNRSSSLLSNNTVSSEEDDAAFYPARSQPVSNAKSTTPPVNAKVTKSPPASTKPVNAQPATANAQPAASSPPPSGKAANTQPAEGGRPHKGKHRYHGRQKSNARNRKQNGSANGNANGKNGNNQPSPA